MPVKFAIPSISSTRVHRRWHTSRIGRLPDYEPIPVLEPNWPVHHVSPRWCTTRNFPVFIDESKASERCDAYMYVWAFMVERITEITRNNQEETDRCGILKSVEKTWVAVIELYRCRPHINHPYKLICQTGTWNPAETAILLSCNCEFGR